jgi:flagellin-specific chaperone FliS
MRDTKSITEVELVAESIEVFSKLSSLLDDKGQELLFKYDYIINKLNALNQKKSLMGT